jgi:hypothetical protein
MEVGFAYEEVFLGRLMITILLWLFLQLCISSSFNEYLYFVVEIPHLLIESFQPIIKRLILGEVGENLQSNKVYFQ